MTPARILILSQHFWPETFRINEIAQSLQEAGCSVSILTGQPNYPEGRVFDGYRSTSMGPQAWEGMTIYRVPLRPRGTGGARNLVLNYLSFMASASVIGPWVLRRQPFDVVFVYGTSPILQALAGVVLKHVKRATLVTWVQDLWPESLETTGYIRNPRALAAVGAVVRWLYRRSDLLLAQSHAFVQSVQRMAGDTPVVYHPNPGERAFSALVPDAAPALMLPEGFNIVFAGNLGTVQALDTLIEAADQLRDAPEVRWILVGSGARSAWLAEEILQRGLGERVVLAGRFPPEAMPGILAQASALLVSLVRSPIMSQTIPSKVQAYLAAGRPIIASMDGEGAEVVRASGAGLACPAEDATALADAVRHLRRLAPIERQRMGQAGQTYYARHFEPAALARQLITRFDEARRRVQST
ncbi:glycosyltransferase family 4 protein [Sphaerotilus sp.]|uniref:glycosyltransferase family 4 protein n=1 Tax=Sphaerotilus sp. TaxID=2093942 RepID=UPI002ACEC784|nr:glycosyltransferase family 4 protein [Sphaerotilus sp.]MDZ7857573.1 glycosyltransferase family 4 protein [Sphaerotilus sp.]